MGRGEKRRAIKFSVINRAALVRLVLHLPFFVEIQLSSPPYRDKKHAGNGVKAGKLCRLNRFAAACAVLLALLPMTLLRAVTPTDVRGASRRECLDSAGIDRAG
jgi:hypothetical protein